MYYEKLHRARGLQETLYMTEVYRVADSVMSRLQHVSCVKQCCFVLIFNVCQERQVNLTVNFNLCPALSVKIPHRLGRVNSQLAFITLV